MYINVINHAVANEIVSWIAGWKVAPRGWSPKPMHTATSRRTVQRRGSNPAFVSYKLGFALSASDGWFSRSSSSRTGGRRSLWFLDVEEGRHSPRVSPQYPRSTTLCMGDVAGFVHAADVDVRDPVNKLTRDSIIGFSTMLPNCLLETHGVLLILDIWTMLTKSLQRCLPALPRSKTREVPFSSTWVLPTVKGTLLSVKKSTGELERR